MSGPWPPSRWLRTFLLPSTAAGQVQFADYEFLNRQGWPGTFKHGRSARLRTVPALQRWALGLTASNQVSSDMVLALQLPNTQMCCAGVSRHVDLI
jgi:hypothetical protein